MWTGWTGVNQLLFCFHVTLLSSRIRIGADILLFFRLLMQPDFSVFALQGLTGIEQVSPSAKHEWLERNFNWEIFEAFRTKRWSWMRNWALIVYRHVVSRMHYRDAICGLFIKSPESKVFALFFAVVFLRQLWIDCWWISHMNRFQDSFCIQTFQKQ